MFSSVCHKQYRFKSGDLGGHSPQVINHISNTSSRAVTYKCAMCWCENVLHEVTFHVFLLLLFSKEQCQKKPHTAQEICCFFQETKTILFCMHSRHTWSLTRSSKGNSRSTWQPFRTPISVILFTFIFIIHSDYLHSMICSMTDQSPISRSNTGKPRWPSHLLTPIKPNRRPLI